MSELLSISKAITKPYVFRYRLRQFRTFLKYGYGAIRRKLLFISIFITERCNGRCKICGMWQKSNPRDLPLEIIESIVKDTGKEVSLCIGGGEPLLHPHIGKILEILNKHKRSFNFLSNGISGEKLIELAKEYEIPSLALSCDGLRETYKEVRGVDNFDNIKRIVEVIRGKVKELYLHYTINPFNTKRDLFEVKQFCEQYRINLCIGLYEPSGLLNTLLGREELYDAEGIEAYPSNVYIKLYQQWLKQNLHLPCWSIRFQCEVWADGTVVLCELNPIPLGNLNEKNIMEIWNDSRTKELQRSHINCNRCWHHGFRRWDVAFGIALKHLIPMKLLRRYFGEHDWDKL